MSRLRVAASRASGSGVPDLVELSRDITIVADSLVVLCGHVDNGLSKLVDDVVRCLDSQDTTCAASALSRLRDAVRAASPSLQVFTSLGVLRVLTGLGLLTMSAFLTLSPASALELDAAPIVMGLAIAGLLLYRGNWSSAVSVAGSAIMIPIAVLDGQIIIAVALAFLLGVSVCAVLIEREARALSASVLARHTGG